MNERIKQIAVQAGVSLTKTGIDGDGYEFEYTDQNQLKFAQLIIQQCCDIVHDKTDDSIRVVHAIKVTFGLD